MYKTRTTMYEDSNFRTNPFKKNPNTSHTYKTNIVFGSMPIGNPMDISVNALEHIMEADILLVESHREFSRYITMLNNLEVRTHIDLQPGAVIYQYQFESEPGKNDEINSILIHEATANNKKVFVVSDEGQSVFLEPTQSLKYKMIENDIPYTVLPGPFSGIQSVVSSDFFVRQFFFGESLPSISQQGRIDTYKRVIAAGVPAIFLLTAEDSRWCVEELNQYFGADWTADFQMSLTMENESHVYGTLEDILKYIDSVSQLFQYENQEKKFAILLFPNKNIEHTY